MRDWFPERPLVHFRLPSTLRNHLVRARLPGSQSEPSGFCGPSGKHCQIYRTLPHQSGIVSTTDAIFPILVNNADCSAIYAFHAIMCTNSRPQYVGQAISLRLWITIVLSVPKQMHSGNDCYKFYQLFNEHSHYVSFHLPFCESVKWHLFSAETEWIWKTGTIHAAGLNFNEGFWNRLGGRRFKGH